MRKCLQTLALASTLALGVGGVGATETSSEKRVDWEAIARSFVTAFVPAERPARFTVLGVTFCFGEPADATCDVRFKPAAPPPEMHASN